jgi:hypothetical protein
MSEAFRQICLSVSWTLRQLNLVELLIRTVRNLTTRLLRRNATGAQELRVNVVIVPLSIESIQMVLQKMNTDDPLKNTWKVQLAVSLGASLVLCALFVWNYFILQSPLLCAGTPFDSSVQPSQSFLFGASFCQTLYRYYRAFLSFYSDSEDKLFQSSYMTYSVLLLSTLSCLSVAVSSSVDFSPFTCNDVFNVKTRLSFWMEQLVSLPFMIFLSSTLLESKQTTTTITEDRQSQIFSALGILFFILQFRVNEARLLRAVCFLLGVIFTGKSIILLHQTSLEEYQQLKERYEKSLSLPESFQNSSKKANNGSGSEEIQPLVINNVIMTTNPKKEELFIRMQQSAGKFKAGNVLKYSFLGYGILYFLTLLTVLNSSQFVFLCFAVSCLQKLLFCEVLVNHPISINLDRISDDNNLENNLVDVFTNTNGELNNNSTPLTNDNISTSTTPAHHTQEQHLLLLEEEKKINEGSRSMFFRYIFHEIRVPLNSISLGLQLLQENKVLNKQDMEILMMMKESVNFMGQTLNDVLSLQKIEEGMLQLEYKPFPPKQIVDSVLYSFR